MLSPVTLLLILSVIATQAVAAELVVIYACSAPTAWWTRPGMGLGTLRAR